VLKIKPLTEELDKLQQSLVAGAARIEECTEEITTLDARKLDLQTELSSRTEEAAELKVLLNLSFPC
jgi:chromosome segregation ATPase